MKAFLFALLIAAVISTGASAASPEECAGVIRVFGDTSSWMSSCFVAGDGSLVLASADSLLEQVGPEVSRTIRNPIFISAYNGQAYQCELKAYDKDLNIALLKLPIKGLPAAPLAEMSAFSKVAYKTLGQLMSGEQMGSNWPISIYGITRQPTDGGSYKIGVGDWSARKAFVSDVDKYKWLFVSDVTPDKPVPNGSMVMRGESVVGMYLNKLRFTGGKEDIEYGRCAMSPEIAKYMGDKGVDTSSLYSPPQATVEREKKADEAFNLLVHIYSAIGAGVPGAAHANAQKLVDIRPEDALAQNLLGLTLTGNGKFEEALKAFDKAYELDPKLPTLRMNRALALVALEKREEAEKELLKAAEEFPTDVRPITALANFYMANEETHEKAREYAQNAVNMATDSPAAKLLLAQTQQLIGNHQEAIDTIGEALKLAPDWGDAWFALGTVFEKAGNYENAERAYRNLVEKQPKNPGSLLTLASFLADRGKKDEATELVSKVKELNPPKEVVDAADELQKRIDGAGDKLEE